MRRSPQAAGFYPGDLSSQVDAFLDRWQIPEEVPRHLVGGILPHAGWSYSGRLSARVIAALSIRSHPRTFVIFASVHVPGVDLPSIYPEGVWETPVGPVDIDDTLAGELLEALPDLAVAAPEAHDGDHAIEVQAPFIRLIAPGARIVPVAMPPVPTAILMGETVGRLLLEQPDVVVLASSDLTHYGPRFGYVPAGVGPNAEEFFRANDARMVECIQALASEDIRSEVRQNQNACGPGALEVALTAARVRGAERGHVLEYTNSHDETHDPLPFESGVGYVGAVF